VISIDFIVGVSIAAAILVASVICALVGLRWRRMPERDSYDDRPLLGLSMAIAGASVAVIAVGLLAWGLYPYQWEYHSYRHVEGTIAEVGVRMLGGDGGTTQSYAVRLQGDGGEYRCDDTRCSLVKPGDTIALWCIREWHYASTPGWVCNFDRTTPGGKR
jgi:hypothetical protein